MIPRIQPEVLLTANVWSQVIIPDKTRDSIRFQAKSLGVLDYSFDAGVTFMQTVGSGEQILGNFSLVPIWFRTVELTDRVRWSIMDQPY